MRGTALARYLTNSPITAAKSKSTTNRRVVLVKQRGYRLPRPLYIRYKLDIYSAYDAGILYPCFFIGQQAGKVGTLSNHHQKVFTKVSPSQ